MDKTAIVTGGTDGIGKEIAIGLARAGCQVLVVGRDAEKGARAESDIRRRTSNPRVDFLRADLGLVRDTRRLASDVAHRCATLSYLVHSAGIVNGRRELTAEGIESNFAINYLSRFVLTADLLPLLERSSTLASRSRILIISGAAKDGPIHFEDVNMSRRFGTIRAVLQFCQANDLFAHELAQRLATSARSVTITCLKVGVVNTNIRRRFPSWMRWIVALVLDPLIGLSSADVAAAAVPLLVDPEFEGVNGAFFQLIRTFKAIAVPETVRDPELRRRLWALSEQLIACALRPSVRD
jgi:NAD(P)-dependent dehydrogenase (short-subunit alcohol dehydrogenase family)